MIGDGEEAALTALLLARDAIITERYHYKIFLIQGGKGVRPDSKEAEAATAKVAWLPNGSLRFASNFMFCDQFRSKLFERHFFNYLKYKLTRKNSK